MARPRTTLVSLSDTPYYHCISRCVRKAFLCGEDYATGRSYEHRRDWVQMRLLELADIFSIDICAYAVMSNHLHVVLRVDLQQAESWSDEAVVKQWHRLYAGSELTRRYVAGDALRAGEKLIIDGCIVRYRERLTSLSWFMRALNEPIARQANKEDGCTGRFWEGRFKSQALLDEAAVLACMAYADLNPIRAKMATTPETSDYTSIQQRIHAAREGGQPATLLPFIGNEHEDGVSGLNFSVQDYLELVDQTGRAIRGDKRGVIEGGAATILERLDIPVKSWFKLTQDFTRVFTGPVGRLEEVTSYCQSLGRRRRQGARSCQRWLG